MPHAVGQTWVTYVANDRLACLFSPDHCASIIETYTEKGWIEPKLRAKRQDKTARVPYWIQSSDASAGWIFEKLERHVKHWNVRNLNLQIDYCQDLRLLRYGPGDGEGWRTDLGEDFASRRKLSSIVFLSRPETYEGGTVEFLESEFGNRTFEVKAGDMLVFASWLPYRIHSIKKGELWTLSTWWMGNRPIR